MAFVPCGFKSHLPHSVRSLEFSRLFLFLRRMPEGGCPIKAGAYNIRKESENMFFIPCFKWNKQYFVQTSCCGTVYRLDPEVGRRIARGEELEIRQEDLEPVSRGWQGGSPDPSHPE